MKKLKQVGFFRELRHGAKDGPSLAASIELVARLDEDRVVYYLENGIPLICSSAVTSDVLNDSVGPLCSPDILTDGEWAWPRDLSYYVKTYHVKLPNDFVADMKRNRWIIQELTESQLDELLT